MLTGLVEPSGGAVLFQGANIADDPIDYRRHVGYVPEEPHLYGYLSGVEYLQLVADLRDLDARVSRKRIAALLELFGLSRRPRRPSRRIEGDAAEDPDFGGAAAQPVAAHLRRAGLRPRRDVGAGVPPPARGAGASGKAVLYCSHELDAVEKTCSRVLVLHHGRIIAHDTVEQLRGTLSKGSLEEVFQQLVSEIDPADGARPGRADEAGRVMLTRGTSPFGFRRLTRHFAAGSSTTT